MLSLPLLQPWLSKPYLLRMTTRLEKGGFSKSSNDVPGLDQLLGLPSWSCSASTVSDPCYGIHSATALEENNLIKHISQVFDFIEKLKISSHASAAQLSLSFFVFMGFLSEGINLFIDIILGEMAKRTSGPNIKGEATLLIVHGSMIKCRYFQGHARDQRCLIE